MNNRGQTIHDYLLGIVLVLLTILAVFTFFPDIFTPFQEPVEAQEVQMSDRLADQIIGETQVMDRPRMVDYSKLKSTVETPSTLTTLRDQAGVPEWKNLYVEVRGLKNPPGETTGPEPSSPGQPTVLEGTTSDPASTFRSDTTAATTTRRIVTMDEICTDGCRLIVRVW